MDTTLFLARIVDHLKTLNYRYGTYRTTHTIGEVSFQTFELFDHFSGDELLNRMVEECGESGVIFDIGSNVGSYSLGLGKGLPEAEVHAFEPNPEMVRRHRRNLEANSGITNRLHTVGISDKMGEETFHIANPPNRSSFSRSYVDSVQAVVKRSVPVPITTIDRIVNQNVAPPPDDIKIDVEGHAESVLRGAKNTLANHNPTLYIEPHHTYVQGSGGEIVKTDRETTLKPLIRQLNYRVEETDYEWICKPSS